jgi:hypothetical protein
MEAQMKTIALLTTLLFVTLAAAPAAYADWRQPDTRAGRCCKALGGRWDESRKHWGFCPVKRLEACLAGAKGCPSGCQ